MKIALATAPDLPHLYEDDQTLIPAFSRAGITALPAVWDDPQVRWDDYDAIVVRSCWGYWKNRKKFLSWIRDLKGLPVWNVPEVLQWNTSKTYLKSFAENGVPIPPTAWVFSTADLSEIMAKRGWDEIVVKPIVSAGGHLTARVRRGQVEHGNKILNEILANAEIYEGAMVQPFLPEILTNGETSLIYFNGKFSHAVQKKGVAGEFRIQPRHGGTAISIHPNSDLIQMAKAILAHIPEKLLYARVDLLSTSQGSLLMELELTEPNLYLRSDSGAADQFVRAFKTLFKGKDL